MRAQAAPGSAATTEKVAVIGVGYVGLPLAVAFSRAGIPVVGYDISHERISRLTNGHDATGSFTEGELASAGILFSYDPSELGDCTCYVITVPTPLKDRSTPDLGALIGACESVGRILAPGALVVVESTVHPGATREVCKELLETGSGLTCGTDFLLAYSPERISPGDADHSLEHVPKLVAGHDDAATARTVRLYRAIVPAGVLELPSMEAAELAKTVENSQRDLNIAFANEVARICEALGVDTQTVLDACATKWNFQRFRPGLVGGHCIPVDPYYLSRRSEAFGYPPALLMAARRTNEGMPGFLAEQLVKRLAGVPLPAARVALLGATFKADIPDMRNSGVIELVAELEASGVDPMVHDPLAAPTDMRAAFGDRSVGARELHDLDMLVLAVGHGTCLHALDGLLHQALKDGAVFADLTGTTRRADVPAALRYWSL